MQRWIQGALACLLGVGLIASSPVAEATPLSPSSHIASAASNKYADYLEATPDAAESLTDTCAHPVAARTGAWICPDGDMAAAGPGASARRYADYVTPASNTLRMGASGTDQCALPLADRTGSWVCPGVASVRAIAPMATTGTVCTVTGCWNVSSNYQAKAYMDGSYGYSDHWIGTVHWTSNFGLNGSQMNSSYIGFTISHYAIDVFMSGNLLHGSHTTDGDEVSGQYEELNKGSVAAGATTYWGGGGYSSYSQSYLNHANVMEVAWEDPSEPSGYWYMYIKSPIAEDPDGNNGYTFRSGSYRFTNSAVGGFHAF
jgi:hypothetical protein